MSGLSIIHFDACAYDPKTLYGPLVSKSFKSYHRRMTYHYLFKKEEKDVYISSYIFLIGRILLLR
jgi:hypothetical protein